MVFLVMITNYNSCFISIMFTACIYCIHSYKYISECYACAATVCTSLHIVIRITLHTYIQCSYSYSYVYIYYMHFCIQFTTRARVYIYTIGMANRWSFGNSYKLRIANGCHLFTRLGHKHRVYNLQLINACMCKDCS